MKRGLLGGLLAVAALLLGACAPAPTAPPLSPLPSVSDKQGGGLTFEPGALWFKAGTLDALDVNITVRGNDVRVNAPQYCRAQGMDILCTVPTLPAGKNFILPMKGSNLSAVATYKRVDGVTYSSAARQ